MSLQYDIEIRYLETGNIGGAVGGIGRKVKDLQGEMLGLGSALSTGLSGALGAVEDIAKSIAGAALAGVAGIGIMGGAVVNMNGKLEETQIALAAIFQANGAASSFGGGMAVAASQMAKMRKDAADLPGEFTDLVNIFQTIAPNTFRGGLGADATRDMAAQTMAMAAIMRIPMHVAAREMSALIEGRAGAHNIMGLRMMGLAGDKAKEFNHLSEAERIARLQKEMSKYGDALGAYRHSFVGLFSTFKDNSKQLAATFGGPLFASVKNQLESINNWYAQNKPQVDAYAHYLGQKLANAFEYGVEWFKQYGPAIFDFATTAAVKIHDTWLRIEPIVARIGDRIHSFLQDPKAFDKLEDAAKLMLAIKVAGPMAGSMGRFALRQGLVDIGGGGTGVGGMGAMAGLEVAGAAAGALAVGLVATAGAAYGLHMALEDVGYQAHIQTFNMWTQAKENLSNTMAALGSTADYMKQSMTAPLEVAGTLWVSNLQIMSGATMGAAKALEFLAGGTALLMNSLFYGNTATATLKDHDRSKVPPLLKAYDIGSDKSNTLKDQKIPNSVTNIQKVEIIVQSNQDPSRIARQTVQELAKLKKNPKSGFIPKWVGGTS